MASLIPKKILTLDEFAAADADARKPETIIRSLTHAAYSYRKLVRLMAERIGKEPSEIALHDDFALADPRIDYFAHECGFDGLTPIEPLEGEVVQTVADLPRKHIDRVIASLTHAAMIYRSVAQLMTDHHWQQVEDLVRPHAEALEACDPIIDKWGLEYELIAPYPLTLEDLNY